MAPLLQYRAQPIDAHPRVDQLTIAIAAIAAVQIKVHHYGLPNKGRGMRICSSCQSTSTSHRAGLCTSRPRDAVAALSHSAREAQNGRAVGGIGCPEGLQQLPLLIGEI